jgi:antitoxin component YwqK of YwqJK toxin-antitoxin module
METVHLNQLSANENGIYLLGNTPFSGFAIETFPDGSLQTQVALMRGLQDGVTRRWHPNGQLESEQHFRNGKPHGWHRKWEPDGTLEAEFAWSAGIRGGGAAEAGTPMTEPSETTYVYDAQGRQTAVIYGPVNAAGV